MYLGGSDQPFSTEMVLKLAVAVALVAMTVGLMLFFNDTLARYRPSVFLLLAIDAAVVLAMSLLSIKIFGRL